MTQPEGPWSRPSPPPAPRGPRPGLWIWLGVLAATGGAFLLAAWLLPAERANLDWSRALWLFGVLALVSRGLVSVRRFNLGATARILAGWAAIFAVAVTAYALRDDVVRLALRVRSALIPAYAVADSGRSVTVGRGEGGAFYVMGQINGAPARFLIDTGATDIVLSPADAERAGLHPASRDFSRPSETANGVGYGAPATLDSLTVGSIRMTDVPVSINQAPMDASLLGMPFLRRLDSFAVRGDQMVLRGRR